MKQILQNIRKYRRKPAFPRQWYIMTLAGIIGITAFQSSQETTMAEPVLYHLPDSLTAIDHSFTEQMLIDYRERQLADSLVDFARKLEGKPYHWGGTTLKGFDCSGFVSYVYRQFGHALTRTSSAQSTEGIRITPQELRKGDLLFFTGTNAGIRRVGHVGIVVSAAEDDIHFVHSSSNGGVKVSALQGYYENRFLSARRLLKLD